MSIQTDEQIQWRNKTYYGAISIGVVKAFNSEHFALHLRTSADPSHGGTYYTSIPISSQSYRWESPTRCGFAMTETGIRIFNDFGNWSDIGCSQSLAESIANECRDWAMPELDADGMSVPPKAMK